MRADLAHALAFVLVVACGGGAPPPEPAEALPTATVTCTAIATTDVEAIVELTGTIAAPPRLDAVLSSPLAGRIAAVAVEEGDQVAAGALLATVEDPALPAGSLEARAAVASATATKLAADGELVRQTRLVETGIGARRELEDARAKAGAAAAELDAAKARAGLASQQLARRDVRAPHAGIVLHVFRRVGESVDGTAATPIAEVADLTTLEVHAQVLPATLVQLHDGLAASVRVVGVEAAIPATVLRVAPAVDATTMLGVVRLRLDARAVRAPIGSAAVARVVVGHHPGLVVPTAALRRAASGADELVVCEGAVARVREVTLGARHETTAEIVTGLAAGERVVVDHALGLEDGQHLVVK